MKRSIFATLIVLLIVPAAQAAHQLGDVTPDVIYGSGNANGSWNVYTTTGVVNGVDYGIELGLRAKVRGANVFNLNPADGTYTHEPGISSGTAAKWNFDFSANVDSLGLGTRSLANTRIDLLVDTDPTAGVNYAVLSDIFTVFGDNEVGIATTGNGGGLKFPGETGSTTLADYTVVQNSMNIGWLGGLFDVNADATYDFLLNAYDTTNSAKIASAWMQVKVSDGEVPEPTAIVVWSLLGVFGIALGWRRRKAA